MKLPLLPLQRALILLFAIIAVQSNVLTRQQSTLHNGEGYAVNDSVRIWYKVEGAEHADFTPILLIHGGPGATARPFERTIGPEIAKIRPVVYMDYRGAGRSDRPKDPAKYSVAILAGDAEALRNHLGIDRWAVFGHSNGGATAITYALKYPDRCASLILCDPLLSPKDLEMNMIYKVAFAPAEQYVQARAIYKSDQSMEVRFNKLLDLIDAKARAESQFYNRETSATLNGIQADLSREIGKGLMEPALIKGLFASGFFEFDAFKSVAKLSMPVCVLVGKFDTEISIDNALTFALTVPDGYVATLQHSGHHPYLEETKLIARFVNDFMNEHTQSSKTGGK